MSIQRISEFVDSEVIPSLMDFVRIPNLSPQFDPGWRENGLLDQAAEHLKQWILKQPIPGISCQFLEIEGHPKAIFARIPGTCADKTVLFYGHYDKQPHFEGWKEGLSPVQPVNQGGRLYGRGVADDGYSVYAALTSVLSVASLSLPYPTSFFLIEGEEESGSTKLMEYVEMLKLQRLDLLIALDSGAGDYNRLWLTSSMRGNVKFDLRVKVLNEGVHSGDASGIVPSAFGVIRTLLNRLEDSATGQCHQSLFTLIPPLNYAEAIASATLVRSDFPLLCAKMQEDPTQLYLNRTWRPAVSYIGQSGMPPTSSAGNVCLPEITIRISVRTPPNKDAKEAAQFIKELLTRAPPYQAEVEVKIISAGNGLIVKPFKESLFRSLRANALKVFEKEPCMLHEGMTIPFMKDLAQRFSETEFLILGVLGPESNAHGPNEMLDIEYMKRVIACIAGVIGDCEKY